jgi:predicted nucleic acid-binding protein
VRYWDASALVPLIIAEPETARARSWLEEDPTIATWAWTRVEIASAIERRVREGTITRPQRQVVLDRLQTLAATWDEVVDVLAVRRRALALLARHPLRAADAAQLGAALLVAEDDPANLTFVCFDGRLALAAEQEALQVLGPPVDRE